MNDERMQILEMLQSGKITVDEATQLLEAAERPQATSAPKQWDIEEMEGDVPPHRPSKSKLPDMIGTYLEGAKLEGARLDGADLTGAYLEGADLRGADLRDADLTGTYLEKANLRNANLSGATLTGAYLERADFENADLAGVNLTGTHMPGAKVRDGALVFGSNHTTPKRDTTSVHGDVVVR